MVLAPSCRCYLSYKKHWKLPSRSHTGRARKLETQQWGDFVGFGLKEAGTKAGGCLSTCRADLQKAPKEGLKPNLHLLGSTQGVCNAASSSSSSKPITGGDQCFLYLSQMTKQLLNESSQFPDAQKRMSSPPRYVSGVCNTPPLLFPIRKYYICVGLFFPLK